MRLVVQGIGAASAFDDTPEKMSSSYGGQMDDLGDILSKVPGDGGDIRVGRARTSALTGYLPRAGLRRVDHYSRLALLASGRAIEDAGSSLVPKESTGLIVATGYGAMSSTFSFLDSYIEKGDKLASPIHFSNSVHNAAAAHISISYGITGPSLTVSQFDLSFFSALITASTWLETGKTDAVLLGMVDSWCEVMGYCMHRFSLMLDKGPYSFGEGSVFFLLTLEDKNPSGKQEYGVFEGITMGQNLDTKTLDQSELIFSPSSTAPCKGEAFARDAEKKNRVRGRTNGFSPTDSGMDALFALNQGKKICCIKQGQYGAYGKMTICPARVS